MPRFFTLLAKHSFHAHGPPRDMTCLSITVLPEKELRATALMKSSKDAAAQVAKRRAIPRPVAEAINLDFALSESLQINKLPAQTLNLICIYLSYLPSFTHLLTYIYILPNLLSGTQVLWQVDSVVFGTLFRLVLGVLYFLP